MTTEFWTAERIARQIADMDRGRLILSASPLPPLPKQEPKK